MITSKPNILTTVAHPVTLPRAHTIQATGPSCPPCNASGSANDGGAGEQATLAVDLLGPGHGERAKISLKAELAQPGGEA